MPYPTKEMILAGTVLHKPEVITAFRQWKKEVWRDSKTGDEEVRFNAIKSLIHRIAEVYEKPVLVEWLRNESGNGLYVNGTIYITGTPSIITSLHELGHHLFGRSELKACRWSIHLFRKVFPRAFEALIWDGHMLRRPPALLPDPEAEVAS